MIALALPLGLRVFARARPAGGRFWLGSGVQAPMCSRYALTAPPEAVASYFRVTVTEAFPPRYNIAPTQPVHIVRTSAANRREVVLVRWGLVPGWVKDPAAFPS